MGDAAAQHDALTAGGNASTKAPAGAVYRRDQSQLCKKLIVGVHGMGDQSRNDFAQCLARLFARYDAKRQGSICQATQLPMGLWDAGKSAVEDHAIGFVSTGTNTWLEDFAFAEVYWADLPRDLEKQGYRLEESKRWTASVVDRLAQRDKATREKLTETFGAHGLQMATAMLEEIAETVRILQMILKLPIAAGLAKYNFAQILEIYMGDVQQVADFCGQRARFLERFFKRMEALAAETGKDAKIHIIAHSEGSVVAFLGLLYALLENPEKYDSTKHLLDLSQFDLSWIKRVESFSTLGAPIDKHLILWPDLFFRFTKAAQGEKWKTLAQPIRWRNYYDFADPVGFNLDTARSELERWSCTAFEFKQEHDHGFRRYLIPGKAHVDYFEDDKLFKHVIKDAVEGQNLPLVKKPKNRWYGHAAPILPFFLVAVVHVAAVVVLHKSIVGDPVAAKDKWGSQAVDTLNLSANAESFLGILGCSALLLGTTVVSRTFRITAELRQRTLAVAFFLICAGIFWLVPGFYTMELAGRLGVPKEVTVRELSIPLRPLFFLGLAVLVMIVAWGADKWSLIKKRSPVWGLRWTVQGGGGFICLVLIGPRLWDEGLQASALMLLTSAATFLGFWWLGILLFDLAYCWKRYINSETDLLTKVRNSIQ